MGPLLGQFLTSVFKACIQNAPKGLLEGTELDFGSILEGTELDFGSISVDNLGVLFGAHVCVFLRILKCMLITSTFCFGAKSKFIGDINNDRDVKNER